MTTKTDKNRNRRQRKANEKLKGRRIAALGSDTVPRYRAHKKPPTKRALAKMAAQAKKESQGATQ